MGQGTDKEQWGIRRGAPNMALLSLPSNAVRKTQSSLAPFSRLRVGSRWQIGDGTENGGRLWLRLTPPFVVEVIDSLHV